MTLLIAKFLLSIAFLIYASQLLIKSTGKLSKYFKISFFSAGVVFVAISTTIPELFIGINSAFQNASNISLGTVLGSNIANLAFILGVALIVFKEIDISKSISEKSSWWVVIVGLFPLLLLFDSKLSKLDGLILLLIFISYIYNVFLSKQKVKETYNGVNKRRFFKDIIIFIIGILILIFSADYAVEYGKELAINFGVPLIVLGISLYAFSTSLPELVFILGAIKDKKQDLAFGDLVGAIIANSTLVLGVTVIISPVELATRKEFFLAGSFLVMLIMLIFFVVQRKIKLTTIAGVVLLFLYFSFLALELL
jgi:cation:H+ antiporter